ncbi:hypothetical protein Aperf_G00000128772 [Anoplocephala perfoliata]
MPCSLGRYNHHSCIYRLREHFAVAFFGQSFYSLPLLATTLYVRWFLYPFILMVFGYPIVDILSRCVFLITLIYTIYWIYDIDTPSRGGRPRSWLRSLSVWKWASQYFPICLIVSEELLDWSKENCQENNIDGESIQLPRSSNYLLGYHPHGSCAAGALITCGTEALNFSKVFPGIKPHVASTDAYHNTPFIRDYVMSFGCVSASRESLLYLLDKNTTGISGNLVAVAVGGAREILESRPGHYTLVLSRRRGFFQLALQTGSHLLPSIGFGETNMFDQVPNPASSRLRTLQDWAINTFQAPLAFFYSSRFIPYRRPVTVVVGRPIECKRIRNPTVEEVDRLREEYKQQLAQLFNKYRRLYDPSAEDIRFI